MTVSEISIAPRLLRTYDVSPGMTRTVPRQWALKILEARYYKYNSALNNNERGH